MGRVRTLKTFQDIVLKMAENIGLDPGDRLVKGAAYLASDEIRETIRDIVGPDDMSPAAQKIRAALRKM